MWRSWPDMEQMKINLMPRPERACELLLGSDNGKWIFERIFATMTNRMAAEAI